MQHNHAYISHTPKYLPNRSTFEFRHISSSFTCCSLYTSAAIRVQHSSSGVDCLTAGGRICLRHAWTRLKAVPAPVSNQPLSIRWARDVGRLLREHLLDVCAVTCYVPDLDQTEYSTERCRLHPSKSQNNAAKTTPFLRLYQNTYNIVHGYNNGYVCTFVVDVDKPQIIYTVWEMHMFG